VTKIYAMNIHQLQATYLVEQDRILIRMNTQSGEELRLWHFNFTIHESPWGGRHEDRIHYNGVG